MGGGEGCFSFSSVRKVLCGHVCCIAGGIIVSLCCSLTCVSFFVVFVFYGFHGDILSLLTVQHEVVLSVGERNETEELEGQHRRRELLWLS